MTKSNLTLWHRESQFWGVKSQNDGLESENWWSGATQPENSWMKIKETGVLMCKTVLISNKPAAAILAFIWTKLNNMQVVFFQFGNHL